MSKHSHTPQAQADGPAWRCLDCGNHSSEHGFYRDWEAVEHLDGNGQTLGSYFTQHVDGGIYCAKCGSYAVRDDKTGLPVNGDV